MKNNNKSPLTLLIVWAELLNPVLDLFNFWWEKKVKQSKVPDIKEVLRPVYFLSCSALLSSPPW